MIQKRWISIGLSVSLVALLIHDFLAALIIHDLLAVQKYIPTRTTRLRGPYIKDYLTISPGGLPAYTGWARPDTTIAPFFTLKLEPLTNVRVREIYTVSIHCSQLLPECQGNHNNFFYSRAYGPSIITGKTRKNGDVYDIDFFFMDAGEYTVEIVLTFSNVQDLDEYPLPNEEQEKAYEGWPLSGFPMQITVLPSKNNHDNSNNLCQEEQLISNAHEYKNDPFQARWRVIDKVNVPTSLTKTASSQMKHSIDSEHFLLGYESGGSTLGYKMDYQHNDCHLIPEFFEESSYSISTCLTNTKKTIHMIFIGDSNFERQKWYMEDILLPQIPQHSIQITFLTTKGGLVTRLDEIKSKLDEIKSTETINYIFFNAGLHEIKYFCSRIGEETRREIWNELDEFLSCSDIYEESFTQLLDILHEFPAEKKIFRTTTASWLKHGNFGFAWPTTYQIFTLSADFIAHINDIAIQTLKVSKYTKFFIMDGYWLSLARPDNTEIVSDQSIKNHMVHTGKEVYSAMCRMILMVIFNDNCPQKQF